jgi:3-phenylpropionate/trans-cinnamate dioxygenase ferredoxin reductase subunit
MSANESIVIVGAGHGGVQAAASLREDGYAGEIFLISDEKSLPYQRPPLSKAFMKKEASLQSLLLRGPAFYTDNRIELIVGERVDTIERSGQQVCLASGRRLRYRHLILATGSSVRDAPFPGAGLEGVSRLRNIEDALQLRDQLENAREIVVIGAGFIGLEFAATAAKSGARVHVVEYAGRVMARAVSSPISEFFLEAHKAFGVDISLGAEVVAIEGSNGRVQQVVLSDGRKLPADLVVVGIGTRACDDLAAAAGLACSNGIKVDRALTSSDTAISAIGDCALHFNHFAGEMMRLESVQNAVDQARVVARKLTGKPADYDAVPWFWSDQGDLKLQMVGLVGGCDLSVCRGDPASRDFAIFSFRSGVLRCVETVNRPGDYMAARRLITGCIEITPQQAADLAFNIKALAGGRPSRGVEA